MSWDQDIDCEDGGHITLSQHGAVGTGRVDLITETPITSMTPAEVRKLVDALIAAGGIDRVPAGDRSPSPRAARARHTGPCPTSRLRGECLCFESAET